jgi:hypothetical protein
MQQKRRHQQSASRGGIGGFLTLKKATAAAVRKGFVANRHNPSPSVRSFGRFMRDVSGFVGSVSKRHALPERLMDTGDGYGRSISGLSTSRIDRGVRLPRDPRGTRRSRARQTRTQNNSRATSPGTAAVTPRRIGKPFENLRYHKFGRYSAGTNGEQLVAGIVQRVSRPSV